MKFAEVLMMETRVVEEERVRAAVKSVHIRKLKKRLSVKKDLGDGTVSRVGGMGEVGKG